MSCFRMEGLAGADAQASSSQPLLGTGTLLNVVEQYALQGWLQCLLNRLIFLGETSTMLFLVPPFLGLESYKS